ncbi:hypothetical protein FXF51_26105 [Nonomuraea sp. PA05]|uniref:hypothetical protein n=1 Tax=Nonomuraea sp. PA05 TaxID=2604466 RepID=UPI0011D44571|nr:hypothetical protein [Nonomuraea sp. PA05]TYB62195.1 hypothetical protein FXF51_26105 [Nonomuraea sp. PA05]
MRSIRVAVIALLVAGGFGAAYAAQRTLLGLPLPYEAPPGDTRDEPLRGEDFWRPPQPPRFADTTVKVTLRPLGVPDGFVVTHVLTLERGDPFVGEIRRGRWLADAGGLVRWLVTTEPALRNLVVYDAPVIQHDGRSATVTVTINGRAPEGHDTVDDLWIPAPPHAFPWSDEDTDPIIGRRLRVEVAGGTIAEVHGWPDEQGPHSVVLTGDAHDSDDWYVKFARPVKDASPEGGEGAFSDGPEAARIAAFVEGYIVNPLLWHCQLALPWVMVLLYARRRGPALRPARWAASVALAVIPLTGLLLLSPWPGDKIALYLLLVVLPLLGAVLLRVVSGRPAWSAAGASLLAVLGLVYLADLLYGAGLHHRAVSPAWTGLMVSFLAATAVAGVALGHRRQVPQLICAAWYVFLASAIGYHGIRWEGAIIGLLGTLPFLAAASLLPRAAARVGYAIVLGWAALALLRPVAMAEHWPDLAQMADAPRDTPVGIATLLGTAVLPLLELGVLAYLLRMGCSGAALGRPEVRGAGIVFVAVAVVNPYHDRASLASAVAAWLMFAWLLPKARLGAAARLGMVGRRLHRRLMHGEVRTRVLAAAHAEYLRGARSKLVAQEVSVEEFDSHAGALRNASERLGGHREFDGGRHASVNSAAGLTPARNGMAGLGFGLVAALPFVGSVVWWYADAMDSANTVLAFDVNLLRWALYPAVCAFVYGYFYPLLRGDGPTGKALALFLAVLVVEAVRQVFFLDLPDTYLIALIRLGQLLVFCLALALYWEYRLFRAAGLPWSLGRDFRRIGSFLTPAATVLVAAATAAATALAGAAISTLIQAPESSVRPGVSVSSTITP